MALYVEYHRDGKKVEFADIDEEMCSAFGAQPHPINFYRNWVDVEGFGHAVGTSDESWKERFPERLDIRNWLQENFEVVTFSGR